MSRSYRLEGVERAEQEGDLVVLHPRGGLLSNLRRADAPTAGLHQTFLPRDGGDYALEGRLVSHDPEGETVIEVPGLMEKVGG
jgi:hypothetical protein